MNGGAGGTPDGGDGGDGGGGGSGGGGGGGADGSGGAPGHEDAGAGGGAPTGDDGADGMGFGAAGAGGGGAGGDGGDNSPSPPLIAFGGQAAVNGGAGGAGTNPGRSGGFGGGGGASTGGGGGGGYAGGGGGVGSNPSGGGGGSSFFAAAVVDRSMEASNPGDGEVVFCQIPEAADLEVTPDSLSTTLEPGQQEIQTLTVANAAERTPLEWAVTQEGDCALPAWLAVTSTGGTLPGGEDEALDVTFDAADLGPGTYQTDLCLDSNDPMDPSITVPLELMVAKTEVFTPDALEVDSEPLLASDGNGLFEPGEQVEVAPAWRNDGEFPQFLDGTASAFTGPAGPDYTLVADAAGYGEVEPGAVASCRDAEMCYQMEAGPEGVERPALHWDAAFDEELSDETTTTWTLHLGDSFADVPRDHVFYRFVETALHHGIALDCGDGAFCPTLPETREMMARSVLTALEGGDSLPEPCTEGDELFTDVPSTNPFCPWIEELARRDVIAGCGDHTYCPEAPVTRAQMAIFLLKTLEGGDYAPPECDGLFTDVPCPSLFAGWIEELANRGITAGCATTPQQYCPGASITRGQCTVFQSKTFGLTLYGP